MSSSRRRNKLPTEALELQIQRLSHDGRGVASINGKIAFVDGALAGETASARYVARHKQYDELHAQTILVPAPERVEPPCAYASVCGGCAMQHLHPDAQIQLKERVLHEQMQHIGGLQQYEHLPALRSETVGYRRKARLAVRYVVKKDAMLVGFREKNSTFIAQMDDCAVLNPHVARLVSPLRVFLAARDCRYTIPQIEVAVGEAALPSAEGIHQPDDVALIVRHLEPLTSADQQAFSDFAREHEITLYLQPGGSDTVHRLWPATGDDRLYYYLPQFGLRMAFHPTDFTQVNGELNRDMIARALEMLDPQKDEAILDLFCGLGNFTLPLATRSGRVVGVEGSDEMVRRGTENARSNGLDNVEFHAANLCVDFGSSTWAAHRYDKILLDPPRSGALEIIPVIAAMRARKILYISCNPATLARDAGELVKHGYRLARAGVMDMFPHTSHVESIAEFVLVKP
jgi:23S rRNA (uracil1939-C5)-methyltransferase